MVWTLLLWESAGSGISLGCNSPNHLCYVKILHFIQSKCGRFQGFLGTIALVTRDLRVDCLVKANSNFIFWCPHNLTMTYQQMFDCWWISPSSIAFSSLNHLKDREGWNLFLPGIISHGPGCSHTAVRCKSNSDGARPILSDHLQTNRCQTDKLTDWHTTSVLI